MSRTSPDLTAEHSFRGREGAADSRGYAMHQAQKHSRRVRWLRIVLPAVAGTGLLLVALFLLFDPLRVYRQLPVQFSNISIEGNRITMEAPKLTGFTRDKKPYSVTAAAAVQDLTQPNILELQDIQGTVDQETRGGTEVRAKAGVYDIKAENLQLHGGIEVHSESGYHVYLNDAFIEIRKGRMTTKNPVNATFPDGTLQAARAEIMEHGSVVLFEGGVVVDLRLPPPETDSTAKSAATGAKK